MSEMKILGYGHYVPSNIASNDDLSKIMDTNDEWIFSRTGIKSRCISDESTSDLAYKAGLKAINSANIKPDEIDLVIVATITPDNFTPSVACSILTRLGIKNAVAFDISAACSGFVYAINTGLALLKCNNLNKALIIGAETLSKIVDYNDRSTAVLFGDGAGAVVIEAKGNETFFYLNSKTDDDNILYSKAIVKKDIYSSEINDYYLHMNGQEVFKFALEAVLDAIDNVLENSNTRLDEVDLIIPHQANQRIIKSIANKKKIDMNKIYLNIDKYGNTSAASIAIALSEAYEENKIKKGNKILLIGFGAGLTWSSALIEI